MNQASSEARVEVKRIGRVLSLAIDNPAQRNALRPEFSVALARELRLASDDEAIGAVVLSGAGKHFCAGGDLGSLYQTRRSEPRQYHVERVGKLNELVRALRQCAKPVIAAVEGHAAGAGCSIALACDLIVAAENAQLTMAYVKVGLNPDGNGSYALARALPPQLAAEIAMTGAPAAAPRLAALGLVNRLAPQGKALEQALAWGAELAQSATRAIGRIKRLLNEAHSNDYQRHLELERALFVEALHGEEAGEGIGAFLEKRKPEFHRGP